MNILILTVGDTKPTVCYYPGNITGYQFDLQVGYPSPLVKSGDITSAPGGKFQFAWEEGDLQPGEWSANLVITDADGLTETTDKFSLVIEGRVA